MFEVGFTEIILILGLALLVLGPGETARARREGRPLDRPRARDGAAAAHPARARSHDGRDVALASDRSARNRRPPPPPDHLLTSAEAADPQHHPLHPVPSSISTRWCPAIEPTPPSAEFGRCSRRCRRSSRRSASEVRAMSEAERDRESLAEGSLISHLIELRHRLLRAVIAVFVCFIPCAIFSDKLFTLVAMPLIEKMPRHFDDRDQPGLAVHGAAEAGAVRRGVHRDALCAVPGVGVRGARAVQAREALRGPAGRLQHRAVLRRRRVRVLRRVPADVRVPDHDRADRRAGHDGHVELSGLRAAAVLRVRHRVRDSGRHRAARRHRAGAASRP